MSRFHARMRLLCRRHPFVALVTQVLLLTTLWAGCEWLSGYFALPLPGSIIALAVVLLLLALRIVPAAGLSRGADWLLAEMLLFFIPAVMAVSQHLPLLRAAGVRIVAVILLGTVLVMAGTAWLVELMWRQQQRHAS